MEKVLSELIHSNEIAEKRLNLMEKIAVIFIPVMIIIGGAIVIGMGAILLKTFEIIQ